MKNLFLSLIVLCGALSASAQTEPNVPVRITNSTACDFTVTLYAFDAATCSQHSVTMIIPAGAGISSAPIVAPAMPGLQYQYAKVVGSWGPIPFLAEIHTPNGSASYPGTGTPPCTVPGVHVSCGGGEDCLGIEVQACWQGTQSMPEILISN